MASEALTAIEAAVREDLEDLGTIETHARRAPSAVQAFKHTNERYSPGDVVGVQILEELRVQRFERELGTRSPAEILDLYTGALQNRDEDADAIVRYVEERVPRWGGRAQSAEDAAAVQKLARAISTAQEQRIPADVREWRAAVTAARKTITFGRDVARVRPVQQQITPSAERVAEIEAIRSNTPRRRKAGGDAAWLLRATRKAPSLLAALDRLLPGETRQPWRLVGRAIFGLTVGLTDDDRAFLERLLGGAPLPTSRTAEAWLVVGRRGGKSRFSAAIAVLLACFGDYRGVLAPGETGVIMVIAADKRQHRIVKRYISALLQEHSALQLLVAKETANAIELTNAITIEIHAASFRSVRGHTLIGAIVDEIAFLPTDDSAEPDTELIAA